jgi:phosphoserine phosphatase
MKKTALAERTQPSAARKYRQVQGFLHGLLNVLLLGGDELIAKLRAKGISVTVMSRAEADFVRRHDDM